MGAMKHPMLEALNKHPTRYMDAAETQPVHFGDPRYDDAPYEERFFMTETILHNCRAQAVDGKCRICGNPIYKL